MALRIFSTGNAPVKQFTEILSHYYKDTIGLTNAQQNINSHIYINNKYYTCKVPLRVHYNQMHWNDAGEEKTDVAIFLFHEDEVLQEIDKKVDSIITNLRPETFMICVHTQNAENQDNEWRYMNEISNCQNIISVLYENIVKIRQVLPPFNYNGLLAENDQDFQIFEMLTMIETTSWSDLQSKKNEKQGKKSQNNPTGEKAQPIETKSQEKGESHQQSNPESAKSKQNEEMEQQMNEQQMEKQMMEFELLMQQMMDIRTMPTTSNNERKQRAEDLIIRLTKNFGDL